MDDSEPRVAQHYDDLASIWEDIADSPSRERLLWPTLAEMLPDLSGCHVLDAGCGSGVYTARLLEEGATVTGIDVSADMVSHARERVPDGTFVQADLGEPLSFLDDESVDVVLCQHVFSHLTELSTPLDEFARVLEPGGTLVVSTHNPVHDYVVVREERYPAGVETDGVTATVETETDHPDYSATERYDIVWNPDGETNRATYYRRSVEALLTAILDAGFEIRALEEPTPDAAFEADYPELTAELRRYPPGSVCIKASQ